MSGDIRSRSRVVPERGRALRESREEPARRRAPVSSLPNCPAVASAVRWCDDCILKLYILKIKLAHSLRYVLLLAILPALLSAGKEPDWKTGKVLNSATAKTYVPAGATTNTTVTATGNTADATSRTTIQTMAIRDTQLVIVSDEFAYVIEDTRTQGGFTNVHSAVINAVSGRHHGCRFIVGDDVKFYQDKAILHVIDADGKECKTEVLRQERLR